MSSSSSSSSPVPFIPNIPVPWPPHVSLPPEDGPCDCPPCKSGEGGSSSGPEDGGGAKLPPADDVVSGSGGVRLYDGKIVLGSPVALTSQGFNVPFGTQLDYNSTGLGANIGFGKNWVSTGALGGLYFGSGYVLYQQGANSIKYFFPTSGGDYATTYFVRDRLFKYDPGTPSLVTYTLTAPDGTVQIFDYTGKLTSFRDAYGNTATVAYDVNGNLQSVAMTSGSESFQYDYTWSSPTGGNVTYVVFSVNGYAVRRAGYAYAGGLLKSIELRDNTAAAGVSPVWSTGTVENCVFTYNSSDLLLHVIPPVVYRQMVNNSIPNPAALDPAVPADLAVLNAYAETEYAYNGSGLVSTMYTRGRNYNYAFDYTTVTRAGTSLNVWCAKTVVTRPDGSKLNVYFNRGGQVMLQQVEDPATGKVWNRLYRQFQEGTGRVVLAAGSDAITVVNPASQWLVTLDSTLGRVEVFSYDGVGNLQYHGLQQGTSLHKLASYTYQVQSVSGLGSIWRTATKTVYTGENSSGAVTSTYAFTYYTGTFQISQKTVTLPVIATGQNGTGLTFTQVRNFDTQGFLTSSVDEMGVTAAYDYYKSRAALKQVRRDTTGLNLTTDYEVDYFGRTTLVLGPAHSIDLNGTATSIRRAQWTYYKDLEGEQRTFGGYKKVTGGATQVVGPVTVTRPNLAPPPSTYAGYRQALRFDAVYSSAGIPSPTYSFGQTTWVRRTVGLYNQAGKLKEEWNYFVIPASGYGTQSTHYGKKLFAYDAAGRLNQTTCAGGTVDKTTFNPVGWPVQEELGTSAGLSVTRVNEFNDNGTLKKATLPVDSTSSNDRITEYAYDWRMRLEKEWTTVNLDAGATVLLATYGYDNQGQVTLTGSYHTAVGSGNRTGSQSAAYDDLGNLYQRTTYAVDSAGATGNSLVDNWFRDGMGRVVRSAPAGSTLTTVTQFDAVGRQATVYQATGTFSATTPANVSSAIVVEQTAYAWDNGGNLISTTGKQRFDNATGNGVLDSATVEPKARVSYGAIYPDALGRTQASANYGTNAAAAWTRPATIPARSNTVLVTSTAYTPSGNVGTVTDPAGIITFSNWDNEDRLITLVENQPGSSSSSSSSSGYATDVRTTRYEYTDDGWLRKLRSDNAATGQQVTEWVYGVTPAQGSALYSNRLVYQKKYPDTTGGTDLVTYQYNRQLQVLNMKDQAGTQHAYSYDQLGRFTADSASNFGSGIDSTINKLENGYNNRGLLIRATSYNTSGGTVSNEIKWAYNDFNQPTVEYQEHTGAVNTSTSLKVQYGYANGSANTIRPTGLTSPDGSAVSWDYVSSLAGALSRPDAVKESSGSVTLATFKFLGMDVGVSLKYDAASNAEWTMRNGASSGDAGDVYTGLDRFGRMVETIWQAGSTELVHTTYGRNRVGGVTWQRNVLAHAMTGSPLPPERLQQDNFYWYDGLQQNYQHQRGDLAGTAPNYTGITNLQQTEIRSFDETGNWLSNYTSSPALTQSRTHNKANEISTISVLTAPTFDGVGNMKTMPKPGAWSTTCTLTWDAWNRLITCTDGTTTTNRYDALARRIRKSITGGEVRDYYYDKQWRSIEERLSGTFSGTDKTRHLWSPFDRWTLIRRQRETSGTLTDTHFCLKDYLDPTALITPAAAVVERFSYDAFGPVRFMNAAFVTQSSSSYAWTFLFHGEFIDSESGLYNYGYRFYHPQLGRWLSRDPIGERGGMNLFRTARNKLVNQIDFLGLALTSSLPGGIISDLTLGGFDLSPYTIVPGLPEIDPTPPIPIPIAPPPGDESLDCNYDCSSDGEPFDGPFGDRICEFDCSLQKGSPPDCPKSRTEFSSSNNCDECGDDYQTQASYTWNAQTGTWSDYDKSRSGSSNDFHIEE